VPNSDLEGVNITVSYGVGEQAFTAVRKATISFLPGTLTLIRGPSGSGKTTLLSVLGCLLTPTDGEVYVCGRSVQQLSDREKAAVRREMIGYIFQAFRLFEVLTAEENVSMPHVLRFGRSGNYKTRGLQLLERVGLRKMAYTKAGRLSGGEKQRVAIARALMNEAPIILADEPTASLDSVTGREIISILRELAEADRKTVVVVSHDERLKPQAHRIVTLQDGKIS